jgi:hypothetical protein
MVGRAESGRLRRAESIPDPDRRETLTRLAVIVVVAHGVGAAVAANGPLAIVAVIGTMGAVGLLAAGTRVGGVFLAILGIVLVAYMFLGRGFAHIGGGPIYIGELLIPIGLLAWLRCAIPGRFGVVSGLLVAFMIWGAIQTLPYIGRYGIDALRDAVTWGYAIYALIVAGILTSAHLVIGTRWFARVLPLFLLWVPLAMFLVRVAPLPLSPGAEVTIIDVKGGDLGVLLASCAAFILVGLYARSRGTVGLPEPILWVLWLVAVAVAGIINRGGLVAAAMVGATIFYLRSATRWLVLGFIALSLVIPIALIDPRVQVGDEEFSVGQMVDNVTSIFGESEVRNLEGTEEFRLAWWGTIIDYTIGGPYFWTGKGFGINLANEDGFQPTEDRSLRAPHNVHFEVLARSGVPGLVLWLALQVAFAWSLLRTGRRAASLPDPWWSMIIGWVFIHWLAALVNGSFDPYLQGPQGGIWFWAMFGVGIAAVRMAEQELAAAEPRTSPAAAALTSPA